MNEPASLITPGLDAWQRRCVRKRLRDTDAARDDLAMRLRNEAAVLSHLAGVPGVIRLVAVEDNPFTLVLEFADGGSLERRLDGGITTGDARRYAQELVSAIRGCHDRGVVHRDIKPSNILFVGDSLRVADFGVAAWGSPRRAVPEGWEEDSVGTPPWSAPELRTNATSVVSPAVDVYGVGKTLAFLIGSTSPTIAAALSEDPRGRPTLDEVALSLA